MRLAYGDLDELLLRLGEIYEKYGNLDVYLEDWNEGFECPARVGRLEATEFVVSRRSLKKKFAVILDT